MKNITGILFLIASAVSSIEASPLILKESSPSGEAIVAISSSDPEFEKYIQFGLKQSSGGADTTQSTIIENSPSNAFERSFSFVSPGQAAAGNGRSFVSTSAFNPFLLPLFFNPINFEGVGLNDFGSVNNWFKGFEGAYGSGFTGNGEVKTVSAVNDNGHVYGNYKTITFDNRAKKSE